MIEHVLPIIGPAGALSVLLVVLFLRHLGRQTEIFREMTIGDRAEHRAEVQEIMARHDATTDRVLEQHRKASQDLTDAMIDLRKELSGELRKTCSRDFDGG